MKPLILSFFLVILGYSLFVDKEKNDDTTKQIEMIGTKPEDVTQNSTDSIPLYANKSIKAE